VPGKISIAFDTSTLCASRPYLVITAHYIDAPPDSPDSWRLASDVLAFEHLPGAHNGVNLASAIACVVDRFDIRSKAWPMTLEWNDMAYPFHLFHSHSLAG
jgi:hypothetical protein